MTNNTKTTYVYDDGSGRPKRQVISNALAPEQNSFTIGTNGDFPSLTTALQYLDSFVLKSDIELKILSGHILEEHLSITNKDYRNVRLVSEDDVVLLSRDYMLKAADDDSLGFINANNTNVFTLGTHIKMDDSGTLYSGNNNFANHKFGISLSNRSHVTFIDDYLNGGKVAGLSDFLSNAIICFDSTVRMGNGSFIENTGVGQNFGVDYTFSGGALAWVSNMSVGWNSMVSIVGARSENSSHHNLFLRYGANAYIQQTTVQGAVGSTANALHCEGARVTCVLSTVRKTADVDSADDTVVLDGSIVSMVDVTGGISQTENIPTSSGLIFR